MFRTSPVEQLNPWAWSIVTLCVLFNYALNYRKLYIAVGYKNALLLLLDTVHIRLGHDKHFTGFIVEHGTESEVGSWEHRGGCPESQESARPFR